MKDYDQCLEDSGNLISSGIRTKSDKKYQMFVGCQCHSIIIFYNNKNVGTIIS